MYPLVDSVAIPVVPSVDQPVEHPPPVEDCHKVDTVGRTRSGLAAHPFEVETEYKPGERANCRHDCSGCSSWISSFSGTTFCTGHQPL